MSKKITENSIRLFALSILVDEQGQLGFQFSAIGDRGERIAAGGHFEFPVFQRPAARAGQVPENLRHPLQCRRRNRSSGMVCVSVSTQCPSACCHFMMFVTGRPVSITMFSAQSRSAEHLPVGVGLLEHPPGPGAIHHRVRRMPQQPLGSAVPNHVPPVGIHHIKPVVQTFQQVQIGKDMAKRVGLVNFFRREGPVPFRVAFRQPSARRRGHAFGFDPPRQREHHVPVKLRPAASIRMLSACSCVFRSR